MAIKFVDKKTFFVQVQRGGVRRTRRGSGTEADAKRLEAELIADLEREQKLDAAAQLLGVDRAADGASARGAKARVVPTFREFFEERWVAHARVVQNAQTQRTSRIPFKYLLYYLADKRLDELNRPLEVNAFVEAMKENGPIAFHLKADGQPRKRRCEEFTNATINKSLQCLKALLNLAYIEQVLDRPPVVNMLPHDNSTPVIPPTDEEFDRLVKIAHDFRDVAPLLPEVIELTAETGLRRAEVFHLTWRSVDFPRACIRVEMQGKGRMINGQGWRPKHSKWREVPLSKRAKAIVEKLRDDAPHATPDGAVIPSQGGSPYVRMDRAENAKGKGWFEDAVDAAGLKGKVTFHGLRHLFAVRLLTRGVPITIVSELLGHSDINLTVKRYGRFASDAKVKWEAVKVLDGVDASPPAPEPAAHARKFTALDGGRVPTVPARADARGPLLVVSGSGRTKRRSD